MLTWEWKTSFDGIPTETCLREAFEKEFPLACERLKLVGGDFLLLPMVSFNSTDGRCFRYLVVMGLQKIPEQAWLYGAADRLLRNRKISGLEGNGLFYAVENGMLLVAVFFDGRLCHWSEGLACEKWLDHFRCFLKRDDLFCRCKNFPEFLVKKEEKDFSRACKDSFWKNMLKKKYRYHDLLKNALLGMFFSVGLLVALGCFATAEKNFKDLLNDVTAPELEACESEWISTEPRKTMVPVKVKNKKCEMHDLQLQGVVEDHLFLANGSRYFKNDSVGDFVVAEILRGEVRLVCDDSIRTLRMKYDGMTQ